MNVRMCTPACRWKKRAKEKVFSIAELSEPYKILGILSRIKIMEQVIIIYVLAVTVFLSFCYRLRQNCS